MTKRAAYFIKTSFFATCLVLGCSGGGTLGCGSNDGGTPKVDSELLGIYLVNRYQLSEGGCDQLMDVAPPDDYLVLYSFLPNDDPENPRLGGAFCGDVERCRAGAREAPEPAIGYSFLTGDDASGWLGYAIAGAGAEADQCRAEVQRHTLTGTSAQSVGIETKTVETVFPPMVDGNQATCSNRDAIQSVTDDLPCEWTIVLEAQFEAGL